MTTSLIKQGISFIKEKERKGIDIKIPGKTYLNDDISQVSPPVIKGEADLIEDEGVLKIRKVNPTDSRSGFSYFLDGIEKKKILFYYRSIPVIYGYTSAVILKRTDKKLYSIGLEETQENFYLPLFKEEDSPDFYLHQEEIEGLGKQTKDIINIGKKTGKEANYPILPDQFIQAAHSAIQTVRGDIEKSLAREWVNSGYNDGWLFIDGRIENKNKDLMTGANIVGVIKSHHACYFDFKEQYKIYSMAKGERSGVFQPKDYKNKKENIFSWYLRLHHDKQHGDNNFGLIRIEVPAEERFLKQADLISNWILLETKPVAFPASRWDRMIYPVKYCEDYLKSKAPSSILINSLH